MSELRIGLIRNGKILREKQGLYDQTIANLCLINAECPKNLITWNSIKPYFPPTNNCEILNHFKFWQY